MINMLLADKATKNRSRRT